MDGNAIGVAVVGSSARDSYWLEVEFTLVVPAVVIWLGAMAWVAYGRSREVLHDEREKNGRVRRADFDWSFGRMRGVDEWHRSGERGRLRWRSRQLGFRWQQLGLQWISRWRYFEDGGLTGGGGSSPGDGCADEAKLVYIIGQDNQFYSFYPPTLDVKLIGIINCSGAGLNRPFSMAVDRQGVAWILFEDGRIFHIDVKTAGCVQSAYVPGQLGYSTFGMGFVSNSVGSKDETLYVADYLGKGLAKINTTALGLSVVGPWDTLTGAAELTGTGDARLYGFFNDVPIIIAEIDKSSGKILSKAPQPTISIGSGWAFAFWGGDFWLFTSPTGQTQIDRYRPADGTTTTVKTGLGTNIVGAGVSTCAPFEPPK